MKKLRIILSVLVLYIALPAQGIQPIKPPTIETGVNNHKVNNGKSGKNLRKNNRKVYSSDDTFNNEVVDEKENTMGTTKTQNDMDNRVKVELNTSLGRVVVELYNETPKHRDNFVKLVDSCFYDGVLFHRVIKNFMVQTGDPTSKAADSTAHLGGGDPGYTIEAEFVYPKYFHKRGALAAARTGDQFNPQRRSSGSQFYIVTGNVYNNEQMQAFEARLQNQAKGAIFNRIVQENRALIDSLYMAKDTAALQNLEQEYITKTEAEYALSPVSFTPEQREAYTTIGGSPHLDGQYTVFGEVIEGYDVIDKIQQVATKPDDRPVEDVKILSAKVL